MLFEILPRASRNNDGIPHSINYEETGTSEELWDRLGRRKLTNMSFFNVFKAPSFALVNSASQSNATGFENVENDMSTQTIPQSFTSTNLLIVYGVGNTHASTSVCLV